MDILNQIIQTMNKEEVRHFKLFSARTQVKGERKDIQLFDYIRKTGEGYEEDWIFEKLYGDSSKNPFYRLKNRLLGDINKSLNLQHIDDDEIVHIFHMLSLSRYFFNRAQFHISLHYIRRAEKKAIRQENYELLDFIYSELIKLSHEIIAINPEEYIQKRQENREKLHDLREIEDILAAVMYRLKVSQGYASSKVPLYNLLERTVDDFTQNPKIRQNPKLRFTLYSAVSRLLHSRHDYQNLEDYLLTSYREFTEEGLFNKGNHNVKLEMLIYIVNTLYKTRKISLSLEYAETLRTALEEFNRVHYKKYRIYYYNALIINYNETDRQKCLNLLTELVDKGEFKENAFHDFLMHANLSVAYFNLNQHSKALKALIQAYIHDGYKLAGEAFKLQIGIYELILRLETSEFDMVERSIEKVRKENAALFQKEEYQAGNDLVLIIAQINRSPEPARDDKVLEMARGFLERNVTDEERNLSFIDYHGWLARKLRIPVPKPA